MFTKMQQVKNRWIQCFSIILYGKMCLHNCTVDEMLMPKLGEDLCPRTSDGMKEVVIISTGQFGLKATLAYCQFTRKKKAGSRITAGGWKSTMSKV